MRAIDKSSSLIAVLVGALTLFSAGAAHAQYQITPLRTEPADGQPLFELVPLQ